MFHKPRIKLGQYGIWTCSGHGISGKAYDPAAAYAAWARNISIGGPGTGRIAQPAKRVVSGGIS